MKETSNFDDLTEGDDNFLNTNSKSIKVNVDPNKLLLLAATVSMSLAEGLTLEELSTLVNFLDLISTNLEAILNQLEINQGDVIQPI